MMWKGLDYKFHKILKLLRVIDLLSNSLSKKLLVTLTNLEGLVHVILIGNDLSGSILSNIG